MIADSIETAKFWLRMQHGTQALQSGRSEEALTEYRAHWC
jgi:hypothetical protein